MAEWIISSSVLIFVVAALRYILRGKVSLRLQYALWALVLVRLLVPVSFGGSGLSVMNAVPDDVPAAIRSLGVPEGAYTLPEGVTPEFVAPAAPSSMQQPTSVTNNSVTDVSTAVIDWGQIALTVWLSGGIALGLCLIVANLRFALKLKRSRRQLDIGECKLPVYESELVETPCMFGLFSPAIYLTPEAAENERVLRHVLTHELTHYSHGDHIWSALRGVCLALHWYNPLVWLAAALSRRDAELACDESTIRRIGENERADYGRTLIGMTCQKRAGLLLTATTMTGSKSSIKERIILIAKKPKMAIYTLVVVILIVAVAVGCTFTGAKSEADDVVIYEAGGFSVAIPNEYIDQLIIHAGDELENDNVFISVYEKASVEAATEDGMDDSGFGWLFTILRYDRVQYEQYLRADGSGLSFYAKDDEWYYGASYPTDVRYYRSGDMYGDETERAKWEELNAMAVSVRYDFVERNDLTAYNDDEARLEYTYDSEHQYLNYYPYFSVNGSKDEVYTLVLSQPATQGEGGIWCVERMTYSEGNVNLWFPDTGKSALEYYAGVQAEHDAGERNDHADIHSAAVAFLEESSYFGSAVIDGSLEPVSGAEDWSRDDVVRWGAEVPVDRFSIPPGDYADYDEAARTWAEAFVRRYVENTSDDSPLKSADAAMLSLEPWAESLISSPKRIIYNMRFVCDAEDAQGFERWFSGWAGPLDDPASQYDGWVEFGWIVELEQTEDGGWVIVNAGTGGFGGWGYLSSSGADDFNTHMTELIINRGEDYHSPENLLASLPYVNWSQFEAVWRAEGWSILFSQIDKFCLTEGRVYGPEETRMWSDVYPNDQVFRNLYVMLTALNTDGAYSDGIAQILLKQRDYDPEVFDYCLEQLTAEQRGVINMLVEYAGS